MTPNRPFGDAVGLHDVRHAFCSPLSETSRRASLEPRHLVQRHLGPQMAFDSNGQRLVEVLALLEGDLADDREVRDLLDVRRGLQNVRVALELEGPRHVHRALFDRRDVPVDAPRLQTLVLVHP